MVAEFVGGARVLSLDGAGIVDRLGNVEGAGARPVNEVDVRGCHDEGFPAEILVLVLARRPSTSLSALQARWNKRVTLV